MNPFIFLASSGTFFSEYTPGKKVLENYVLLFRVYTDTEYARITNDKNYVNFKFES